MITCTYQLELSFEGPLLSQTAGALTFGTDAAMQRYRGQPALNGSLIRGNIRHTLRQFKDLLPDDLVKKVGLSANIKNWFGQEGTDAETWRSTLDFDFFWLLKEPLSANQSSRTRIRIDEQTGTVKRGALQVLEDAFPSGIEVSFCGEIFARFQNEAEQQDFEHWFNKALSWIAAMGSQKGVGYGRLTGAELKRCEKTKTEQPATIQLKQDLSRVGLKLKLDRPFNIGKPRVPSSNRIETEADLPGRILKGVIAQMIAEKTNKYGTELSQYLKDELDFDKLVFTHFKPLADNEQYCAEVVPLNLAKVQNRWIAFTTKASEKQKLKEAPAFQPDWKNSDWQQAKIQAGCDISSPERLLVVRTAIEAGYSNIADESKLFSMECIDPADFHWCGDVELSAISPDKRALVLDKLQHHIEGELRGIGKTKSRAKAVFLPEPFISTELPEGSPDYWQITLRTPARILPMDLDISGTNDWDKLQTYYADYFSDRDFDLENYFAQQHRHGGAYYNYHFRKGKSYKPEWLTNTGSVFILKGKNQDNARHTLTEWLQRGLPPWERTGEPANWQTTPHLREHGYGAISIKPLNTKGRNHEQNSQ